MGGIKVGPPGPACFAVKHAHQIDDCIGVFQGFVKRGLLVGIGLYNFDSGQRPKGPCTLPMAGDDPHGFVSRDERGGEGPANEAGATHNHNICVQKRHRKILSKGGGNGTG